MKSLLRLMVVLFVLMLAHGASAGLTWGSGANIITDFNGDPVDVTASFDPTEGVFAQLLRITSGSTPSDFVNSGNGASGFDVVIDTTYCGQNDDLSDPGTFAFAGSTILNDSMYNGWYYVRVFDAPQATVGSWNLGTAAPIPTGAGYYFQSSTYEYTHNETEPSQFNFGSGQTLNPIVAIPEPTSIILVVSGLAGLVLLRRKNG